MYLNVKKKEHNILKTEPVRDLSPEKRYDLIREYLDDDKAEDINCYDLRGHSPLADFMIIATGRSSTHVKALAENLQNKLRLSGVKDIKFEGQNMGDWIIVDAGDVIVHIYRGEVRQFYDLDKLWQEHLVESSGVAHIPTHRTNSDGKEFARV